MRASGFDVVLGGIVDVGTGLAGTASIRRIFVSGDRSRFGDSNCLNGQPDLVTVSSPTRSLPLLPQLEFSFHSLPLLLLAVLLLVWLLYYFLLPLVECQVH